MNLKVQGIKQTLKRKRVDFVQSRLDLNTNAVCGTLTARFFFGLYKLPWNRRSYWKI